MFKNGTKQGWGQESGGGTGCHAKTEVLGGECVDGWVRGCVWEGGFFFVFKQGKNARRRHRPSARDARKTEPPRWVRWCRTMVQNHHRGGW